MTESASNAAEMTTAALATKALSGDFSAFPGGWMLEKLSKVEVFGKQASGLAVSRLLEIEAIGGVSVMNQAPRLSSSTVGGGRSLLMRQVPSSMRRGGRVSLGVGDRFPSFSIEDSAGQPVTLESLRGKPFVMRLTRAASSGMICPACMPGMDDLISLQDKFAALGTRVLVVIAGPHHQARAMQEILGLNYTLYGDPDFTLFEEFETRFSGGLPMPAWIIADENGVIRYLWRAQNASLYGMKPHPRGEEVLAAAKECLNR
ncbi:MAG: redoxin domain-containing protein [Steroidobacteraceae bacterium]